jgi:hypothetical protein
VTRSAWTGTVSLRGGDEAVTLGTPCDPAAPEDTAENPCARGSAGPGPPLVCDPIERACAVACNSDADCRAAGLGYVCDLRSLQDLDDRLAGETDPRRVCVNRACF